MNINDIQVIKRYWDRDNDCEPTYPHPSIVWWYKGNAIDGIYFSGELLTDETPFGEICGNANSLEELKEKLIDKYNWYVEDDDYVNS